jgi:hypothetical protein
MAMADKALGSSTIVELLAEPKGAKAALLTGLTRRCRYAGV